MKVINLSRERMKRNGYKGIELIVLLDVMIDFLEENPMPIKDKTVLKDGINLFTRIYVQANTVELRTIAGEYIKLYHVNYAT